jgi:hypothetical protein|tara:strand:- start:1539 stop:2219 length:681 start_codon:yes stop_codon:yes gene_type:complete
MRDVMIAGALLGALHGSMMPVMAGEDKITKGYHTMDAMGCMLLQECTNGVQQIKSSKDLRKAFPDSDWSPVADEFDKIMKSFSQIGTNVYLADPKYFPPGHRGVYHTVSNHFYLNKDHVHRPHILMSVTRHEGWHAAQDCMAGTIKNNMIAIIMPEESVPMIWRTMAERTYPPHAVPWEAEAGWAGRTENMTQKALDSCARGTMWSDYDPTPMTREWLEENGFLSK